MNEVYIDNKSGQPVGKGSPNSSRYIRADIVHGLATKYRAEHYINRALRKKLRELEACH